MSETVKRGLLEATEPVRMYSSSALHAARYRRYVGAQANLLQAADELQNEPDLPALAVVDEGRRVRGILRRDRLFALLGKPFGREVLGRSKVAELIEEVPSFDAHADLFEVAERMLPEQSRLGGPEAQGGGEREGRRTGEPAFCTLVGEDGRFLALLSTQDLANYLSRMTQDDIELAGRLQERLLAAQGGSEGGPGARASTSAWSVEAWSRPAKGVGGDFYYSRRLEDGRLFLALCDVSGKGVAASLIVSMVWGMLRMYDFRKGLRELVLALNESIVATFHMEKYLTGVFLIYDPATRALLCADMGHSHCLVLRDSRPRALKGPKGNLPIGVEAELDPVIYPYRLRPGDAVFLYSDGIVEQEGPALAEFGELRLVGLVASAMAGGRALHEILPQALDAHRGGTPQQDDMSFLLLSTP
jgi:sigma-B regulation protein RsbU (phosphoserine phosphatase)